MTLSTRHSIAMLSVIFTSPFVLSVVMLSVIMLSFVALWKSLPYINNLVYWAMS